MRLCLYQGLCKNTATPHVGDDYFADVISRYSLRQAIEERFVKKVEYVAEMPETNNPEESGSLSTAGINHGSRSSNSEGFGH